MKSLVLATILFFVLSPPANSSTSLSHKEAAVLASRLGVSTLRLWTENNDLKIPPSKLSPDSQNQEIEWGLMRYQQIRNGYGIATKAVSTTQITMGGLIGGAILYGGPQATVTVPLTLLGAASYISLDLYNDKVEQLGRERSAKLLGKIKEDLIQQAGVSDFHTLVADPELFRSTLIDSQGLLQDVKERALVSGDPNLIGIATDVLHRTAVAVDLATLDELATLSDDVGELEHSFVTFIGEVQQSRTAIGKRLDEHAALLDDVSSTLHELSGEVKSVESQVSKLGRNQGLITDFIFSGLPPGEKVSALRSGLLDERMRCPKSSTDCNVELIRNSLIQQFEKEADVVRKVEKAGQILQGIGDVQEIASNLGIELGSDGEQAFRIANGAVSAYISFMTGNYLGTVSSVTGMFGKRSTLR